MRARVLILIFPALLAAGHSPITSAGQPQTAKPSDACCAMGHGSMGHGMAGVGHIGMLRHRAAMMGGIPAPYRSLGNPLPRTSVTVRRGADVYARNCAACHGPTGHGDGDAGRRLSPPPADLAGQTSMPRADALMYWTIAEGGTPFGTAMPSFRETLSKDDIWAVIAYVQAGLPPVPRQP